VVQPPERQHNPEQQPDRHQDRQILQCSEPDQLEHHALRELIGGRTLEDAYYLVGNQNDEQHAGHRQRRRHHLAQYVAAEDASQRDTTSTRQT
jgi:hypothetical protein